MSQTQSPQTGGQQSAIQELREDINRLAAERANDLKRIAELESTVDELQDRIDELDARAPTPSEKTYNEMDRSDKATVVKSKLENEAESTTGAAKVTYKGVVRMFDGKPSSGHAYDIMDTAADGDGFDLGTGPDGTKRLTFNESRL